MLALSGFIYITGGFTLRNIQSCESRLSCCKQRKCGAAFFLIKPPKMFLFLNAYNTMNLDMIPSATADNTECMTSLEIAEITGKEHSHVMRDIRAILAQGVSESNFGLSSYKQPQPKGGYKEVAMYKLTPKGMLLLASGYNVLLREKIINRWHELEAARAATPIRQSPFEYETASCIQAAKTLFNTLDLSSVQKIQLANGILNKLGIELPPILLEEKQKEYATPTELLKSNGSETSVQEFNKALERMGYIVKCESRRGSYMRIVGEGLKYGKNIPRYADKTDPRWQVALFPQLLKTVLNNTNL